MTLTTKAIVAQEPAQPRSVNWSLEDVDVHSPGDDELLVEMRASGICHTDIVLSSVSDGTLGINYPKVVGHEGSGVVCKIGKNVSSVKIGDPVLMSFTSCSSCAQCCDSHPAYCDGFARENYTGRPGSMTAHHSGEKLWSRFFGHSSFAQYSIVSNASVVNAKDLVHDDQELQLFAPLGCGFQTGMGAIQNTASASSADTVMILGLGAVGMGALMTAKIQNCKEIVAVDRVKERLELAKTLGATHTLDTSSPGFTTLDEEVRKSLPSRVSIVIETTGVPDLITQSLQLTQARGKLVCIGVPPLDFSLDIHMVKHINSGRSVVGCIEGDCIPKQAIPRMIQWYREGRFPIDKLVQFFEATGYQQALDSLKAGTVIKPVLIWKEK